MRRILAVFLALCLCIALLPSALCANVKLLALTFDDGPDYTYTPLMLDALKERGVKATFFLVGEWLAGKGEVIARIQSEGHQIGSHSYNHVALTSLADADVLEQFSLFSSKMSEFSASGSYMLRPPYGKCDSRVAALAGVPVIHWSIDPAAGRIVDAQTMADKIVSQASDGAIILMHDTTQANVDAVCLAVDALQARGYEFVTVNELFRLKGVAPQAGAVYRRVDAAEGFDEGRLSEHWAYGAIKYVQSKKIMQGDGAGFKPNGTLTRAMAVTVLWRMAGSPGVSGSAGFCDVPDGKWYGKAVTWAQQKGIILGYSASCFGPEDNMTREQFYCALLRYIRLRGNLLPSSAGVTCGDDARISAWARDSVMAVRAMGFVSKNERELFRPHDDITRAEAAELLAWYGE